jgi:hypothetical protein
MQPRLVQRVYSLWVHCMENSFAMDLPRPRKVDSPPLTHCVENRITVSDVLRFSLPIANAEQIKIEKV